MVIKLNRALAVVGAALCSGIALGQVQIGNMDTVAWLAADSDLIVSGRIEETKPAVPETWQRLDLVTFNVEKTFKGPRRRNLKFVVATIPGPGHLDKWAKSSGRILVFLSESKRLAAQGTVFRPSVSKIEWAYAREPYAPRAGYDENSMLDLDPNAGVQAFSMDLRPLSGPKALEAEVRKAVVTEPHDTRTGSFGFTLEHDEIKDLNLDTRQFYGILHLSMPIDTRLEHCAQRWLTSKDPNFRREGALALVYFRSSHNTALLRALLNDTAKSSVVERQGSHTVAAEHYPVREAAQSTLEAWGE